MSYMQGQPMRKGENILLGGDASSPTTIPFSKVVVLLHMDDGSAGNTADSSSYARTVQCNSETQDTVTKVFGAASRTSPGGGPMFWADSAELTLGTKQFQIEGWFKTTAAGTTQWVGGQSDATGSSALTSWGILKTATNRLRAFVCEGAVNPVDITGTTALVANQWYYYCFQRLSGNVFNLYLGTTPGGAVSLEATQTLAVNVNDSSQITALFYLGAVTSNGMVGNQDEFRMAVDASVAITAVPDAAFPNA